MSGIRLIELQVEHYARRVVIEQVCGPISVRSPRFPPARRALAELVAAANDESESNWINLSVAVDAYNARLDALRDHQYDDFQLETQSFRKGGTDYDWRILAHPEEEERINSQLNFEVPLFTLNTEAFRGLLSQPALVQTCQTEAATIVTGHLGAARDSLLECWFVLYFYSLATECYCAFHEARTQALSIALGRGSAGQGAGDAKNHFEFLPKASLNDLLRVGLPRREQKLLAALVTGAGYPAFRAALTAATLRCVAARWLNFEPAGSHYNFAARHDGYLIPGAGLRYRNENPHAYGSEVLAVCGRPVMHEGRRRACARPTGHGGSHAAEPPIAKSGLTSTGKPLPAQMQSGEPVLVFEMRGPGSELKRLAREPAHHTVDAERRSVTLLGTVQT